MPTKLNETYRKAAQEFADRAVSALKDNIDSIVLYGSVARSEAREDSDIDILVVSPEFNIHIYDRLNCVRNEFTYENGYAFLVTLVHYSRSEFIELFELGAPFISEILCEGVTLYDNGVFSGIHKKAARVR